MAGLANNLVPGTQLEVPAGPSGIGLGAQALLPVVAGRLNFLTGWDMTWTSTGTGTVDDIVFVTIGSVTLQYLFTTIAGASGAYGMSYPAPLAATAIGTAISVGISAKPNRASVALVAHGFLI